MSDGRSPPVSVCMVEDDGEIRQHLGFLLRQSEKILLLNSYSSAEKALAGIPKDNPEVVLMDINLPNLSGIDCVRQLKAAHPGIQFLMLTIYEDSDRVFQSLSAGASGYLLKRSSLSDLVEAIQEVRQGGSPMTSHIARKVVQFFHLQRKEAPGIDALTEREHQVLDHLARGDLYKEIAEALGISLDTVRKHVQSVYQKLHVRSRTEAVVKYIAH